MKWIDEYLEEAILIVLLVAITFLMGAQVLCRYVLNFSLSWSEELVRYLFIYMAFISISFCIKRWISIKIDQIMVLLKKRTYAWAQLVLNVILTLFFVYMAVASWQFLMQGMALNQLSPALQMPMAYVQAAPLIGFSLSAIRTIQQVVLEWKVIQDASK